MAERVPLVAPCITDTDRTHMAAAAVSGDLFDEETVRRFEEAFADLVGCRWAVAVNSGTNALAVAMDAAIDGTWVSIPSFGCVAIRNAAHLRFRHVHFADTEWDVRTATAYTYDTRVEAAVVAHMFGQPTHSSFDVAAEDWTLVEDWTLSLGAKPSLFGKVGVCSFNADKMVSTGRGGIIFGDDDRLRDQVVRLVHYDRHTDFGYSVAMSSLQATLGLSQLQQLPSFIERRRELAARYTDAFRPAGIECPDADCGSVFFRYLVAVDDPAAKVAALADRGVQAGRGVYPPLHRLAGLDDRNFPGTTAAVGSLLSVPVHPSITDGQAAHVIESVMEVCAP